jgi:hypothetical protein
MPRKRTNSATRASAVRSLGSALRLGGIVTLSAALYAGVCGYHEPVGIATQDPRGPNKIFRLDGKYVHNVGRLQLQITNIGETGNQSNPLLTTVPSAEWPSGSGHDYLFAAGLWIGALDASGIPHVTTATYEREFSPEITPTNACADVSVELIDDVREAYEGIPGGNRVISSSVDPDDDGDGFIDEDFLNGKDDDGDGLCDEDYAAVGQQMLSCEYYDNIPQTRQQFPEHVPLGLRVRQTSYSWATPGQNDFVGMDYKIKNISGRTIRNVVVGIFADMDVGSRAVPGYFIDDQVGLINREIEYIGASGDVVRRKIQMGYMYDNQDNPNNPQENKGGDVPGYFGCMFLNHTTDPSGTLAPKAVGITSYKFFSGSGAPVAAGGDPENDAQRYQLMTDPTLNPDALGELRSSRPLDYRFVMATGPFRSLLPESTLTISVGWVMGLGLGDLNFEIGSGGTLVENAIAAQQVFDGLYTDLDGSTLTGQCGKETCLRSPSGVTFVYQIPESSVCRVRFWSAIPVGPEFPQYANLQPWDPFLPCEAQQLGRFVCTDPPNTPGGQPTAHCASADTVNVSVGNDCVYVDLDCNVNTGQGGREHLVNWVAAAPLPAPVYLGLDGNAEPRDFLDLYRTQRDSSRVSAWFFPGDRKVTLKWNNFAEQVRDAQRGNLSEFVGYRVYKAAGWNRPLGTNGPSRDLWSLLGEWREDPKGTPARRLSELIDPSTPIVSMQDVNVKWDPVERRVNPDTNYVETDTLFAVGRYSYVDENVLNGFPYFYSIVPVSIVPGATESQDIVLNSNPSAQNVQVVYPRADAQPDQEHVYVVPNPYRAVAEWDLVPREEDPSGTKATFRNLPAVKGTIRIYSLAGDLVRELPFNGSAPADLQYGKDPVATANGSISWNLISRNGQKIVSGIYLFSVDTELGREIGKFVIIR